MDTSSARSITRGIFPYRKHKAINIRLRYELTKNGLVQESQRVKPKILQFYEIYGVQMNKTQLIDLVAEKAGASKAVAEKVINAYSEVVTETLGKGEEVSILGFGSYKVAERAEREGRNPSTGEVIKIPAAKVAKFVPGKKLKEAVTK